MNNRITRIFNRLLLGLLAGYCLAACSGETEKSAVLFPMDSLITSQIKYLTEAKATVQKTAILGNAVDRRTLTPPDSTPLAVFRELEAINKPINRDAYIIDDGLTDVRSNLKVKVFTAKVDEDEGGSWIQSNPFPITSLRIYYRDVPKNIRRIEAAVQEENSLFTSARHFLLEFQEIHGTIVLTSYAITGGQKMYLGDTVRYSVKGSITLPN
ncbi:MAG TPA: hypothetical protein VD816_02140 [Ohtaekwangia sp.]|nr:hypothetical protein [Ohtaekwangia sp.]